MSRFNVSDPEAQKIISSLSDEIDVHKLDLGQIPEIIIKIMTLVEQMKGNYKVKNAGLKPLYNQAQKLASQFSLISFTHIPREKNKKADQLVNQAIDRASLYGDGR